MDDREEDVYLRGQRAAWNSMHAHVIQELGYKQAQTGWIAEREAAIAVLRDLCDEFGDNDWSEDLHLADIIDKHLGDHLRQGSDQWAQHLAADAPSQRCSTCGRNTWSPREFGKVCGMPQPDGSVCDGYFEVKKKES